jgi:hypothetical protein
VNRDQVVRKLRELRRLERRLTGTQPGDPAVVWEQFFALEEGVRVKYPLMMLVAFDRRSRERAFRDYLLALWARSLVDAPSRTTEDRELAAYLGLDDTAGRDEIRSAFRRMARELHPDLGGDELRMRELIERYRSSSFGSATG